MKESDNLVTLAQEFWDTDQVLFARGLLPRDWLLASELAECSEVRMCESSGFKVCASDNVLIASDWLRRESRNSQIGETGRIWSDHLLVAATKRHILQVATYWFLGRSGARQTDGSKSRAVGSHPNPQPCRREVECEIRDEGHHAQG